jgi:aspartyl/asparaginyl beta-hydroxylase (cupin superfamily)
MTIYYTQIKHIPGLLTVVVSLLGGGGHIAPHCDFQEGFQMVRHHMAIKVPEPAARFKICGRVYEWEEKHMMSFNNSIPHEVINPSPEPRLALLFDSLLPGIHNSVKGRKEAMHQLNQQWSRTLDKIKMLDHMTLNATSHH